MKKLFYIFFILIHFQGKAQIISVFADQFSDSAKTRIGLYTDYSLNSNAFTSTFLYKFYSGAYLDTDLKNSVLRKVKNKNRIGAENNYCIYAAFKLDSFLHKKNTSLFFCIKDREHFDARFSKDLFKVGFYGNALYAGETANFNDFNLNLIRYQQLQVGLFSSQGDSASCWGIGISLLKGEQYRSIYAKKAELFTSEDGQYIDFNTSIQMAQSDTANKGLGAFNGLGASIDIYFEAPFKTRFGNSKIKVSVSDIGLIQFNSKSLYLKQDSLFHYSGFNVNTIYSLQDSTFSQNSKDSIVNSITPYKKQSVSVSLPATLDLSFQTRFSKHFQLNEGIRYVFNANYNLLFYLRGNYIINNRLTISSTIAYGGYSNFNYGIGVVAHFKSGFVLYLGSNNIEGYITPQKALGQGAYISLIKQF